MHLISFATVAQNLNSMGASRSAIIH